MSGSSYRPRVAVVRGPFLSQSEIPPLELLRDRFDLTLVCSRDVSVDTTIPVVRLPSIGTALRRLPKVRRVYAELLNRALGSPHRLLGLERVLEGVDVIDVPETQSGITAQAMGAVRRTGAALVISVWENTPFFQEENPRTRRISNAARAAATAFAAHTEQIRRRLLLEGVGGDRVAVVYAGIDTSRFAPGPKSPTVLRRFGVGERDVVILFVGKLHWEKGVADLVRSVHGARSLGGGDLTLVVLGRGRERRSIVRLITSLGLEDDVTLIDVVPYADMPAVYRCADIVVVPSKPYRDGQEQCSRVVQEAMACGRAVVATACGGSPELLDGAGILVPPADHIALAETLGALAGDRDARADLGDRARVSAVERFSIEAVADTLAEIYGRCLGSGYAPS